MFVLFAINFMNFYDRQVVGAIGERIKQDWHLTDSQLALLSTAFVLLYAVVGLPLGRWADTGSRRVILSASVLVWSVFTALSGLAAGFTSLFIFRLGVGVGEAGCAPAANSLIGDLFPPERRARAIGIFMLGLPLGLERQLPAEWTGRRMDRRLARRDARRRRARLPAGSPCPPAARTAARCGRPAWLKTSSGSTSEAIRAVLAVPSMRWIIASGALLNLIMYALASFVTSYLVRYHGLGLGSATRVSGVVYGVGGAIGILAGGWLADHAARSRVEGRLQLAAVTLASRLRWPGWRCPRAGARRSPSVRSCPGLHLLLLLLSLGVRDDPGCDRAAHPGDGDGGLFLRVLHVHRRGAGRIRAAERRPGGQGARGRQHARRKPAPRASTARCTRFRSWPWSWRLVLWAGSRHVASGPCAAPDGRGLRSRVLQVALDPGFRLLFAARWMPLTLRP